MLERFFHVFMFAGPLFSVSHVTFSFHVFRFRIASINNKENFNSGSLNNYVDIYMCCPSMRTYVHMYIYIKIHICIPAYI